MLMNNTGGLDKRCSLALAMWFAASAPATLILRAPARLEGMEASRISTELVPANLLP